MKKNYLILGFIILCLSTANSQPWKQNDAIFNPSGIPGPPFSQPRFADLDADGDFDMIIGTFQSTPHYLKNIGSATAPHFVRGEDIFFCIVNDMSCKDNGSNRKLFCSNH